VGTKPLRHSGKAGRLPFNLASARAIGAPPRAQVDGDGEALGMR